MKCVPAAMQSARLIHSAPDSRGDVSPLAKKIRGLMRPRRRTERFFAFPRALIMVNNSWLAFELCHRRAQRRDIIPGGIAHDGSSRRRLATNSQQAQHPTSVPARLSPTALNRTAAFRPNDVCGNRHFPSSSLAPSSTGLWRDRSTPFDMDFATNVQAVCHCYGGRRAVGRWPRRLGHDRVHHRVLLGHGQQRAIFEFVEFTNVGAMPVNMTGWSEDDSSATPGKMGHILTGLGVLAPVSRGS